MCAVHIKNIMEEICVVMAKMGVSNQISQVIFGILGFVVGLIVIGQDSVITLINNALTGLCDSGWPLASLFSPSTGIMPLVIMASILGGAVYGATKLGSAIGGK